MLSTRNILLVAAVVVAAHIYSSTVEAQLFRRNRCCQPCCPAPAPTCCPTPAPTCCPAPAPTCCPPVQCCPGTSYAPMASPTPASGQWMATPDPCNVWISDPNNQEGVIVGPGPGNGGDDGPPQDQACLALYTECMEGCASCTGGDATKCQEYCSTKRNNCSLPPRQRVPLPDPPSCYQPVGVDPNNGS